MIVDPARLLKLLRKGHMNHVLKPALETLKNKDTTGRWVIKVGLYFTCKFHPHLLSSPQDRDASAWMSGAHMNFRAV